MLNFLGLTENRSVLAGTRQTERWVFCSGQEAEPFSLDHVTFCGHVCAEGTVYDLQFGKSALSGEGHVLIVTYPALPAGRHPYEVFAVADTGERTRLLSGHIGVVPALTEGEAGAGEGQPERSLLVRLPGKAGRCLQVLWSSSHTAQYAAEQARYYWQESARHAQETQTRAERLSHAVQQLEGAEAKLAELDQAVEQAQSAAELAREWAAGCIVGGELQAAGSVPYWQHDHTLQVTDNRLSVSRYDDLVFYDSYASAERGGTVKPGASLTVDQGTLDVRLGTMGDSHLPVSGQSVLAHLQSLDYVTQGQLQAGDFITRREHEHAMTGKVDCAGGVQKLALLSVEEYGALSVKAADTLYLLY